MSEASMDGMKKLTPKQLDQVTGGQWTPADWIEGGSYTVIEDAPDIQCGECMIKGRCQKVDYLIDYQGQTIRCILYRCDNCGAVCGM